MKFVTADLHLLHKNVLKFDSSQKHRGQYKGNLDSMHLFGHHHGSVDVKAGRGLDVGYDVWGKLLTLEEAYNMTGALPVRNKHC